MPSKVVSYCDKVRPPANPQVTFHLGGSLLHLSGRQEPRRADRVAGELEPDDPVGPQRPVLDGCLQDGGQVGCCHVDRSGCHRVVEPKPVEPGEDRRPVEILDEHLTQVGQHMIRQADPVAPLGARFPPVGAFRQPPLRPLADCAGPVQQPPPSLDAAGWPGARSPGLSGVARLEMRVTPEQETLIRHSPSTLFGSTDR